MPINNHKTLGKIFRTAITGMFACSVLITGCANEHGKKSPAAHIDVPAVVVSTVYTKTVPIYGEYVATIDPSTSAEIVDIRARVEAFLLTQNFQEGKPVKKGQVLFTLDSRTYVADLNMAKAQLDQGKADLEQAIQNVSVMKAKADVEAAKAQLANNEVYVSRMKPLALKKAVPQQDYDTAVTNMKVAKANLDVAKATLNNTILNQKVSIEKAKAEIENAKATIERDKVYLSYCTITSPIDGIAGKRLVYPGNLVGHGEATLLTQITNLDPIRINFNLSEYDYLRIMEKAIKLGHRRKLPSLELILGDGTVYKHNGKIAMVEPTIDPKTGTINVVGEFTNPDRLLRPGMFGRMRLPIDLQKDAVLMAKKAIMVMQSSKIVYIVDEKNKVAMRSVALADEVGQDVIVLNGVKPGDRVIVEGQLKARPDMEVNPVTAPLTTEKGDK